jgi:hypothetical protein
VNTFTKLMRKAKQELGLKPGDIYEDCAYHPVVCVGVDYKDDDIWGVSLIDGTHPRSCSLIHCGVVKLTIEEAWRIKQRGPPSPADRRRIPREKRWWTRRSNSSGRSE